MVDLFKEQGALPEEEYLTAIENTNLLYDMTEDFDLDTSIKYPILYGSREADSQKFSETVETMFKDKLDKGIIPASQKDAFRSSIDEEMRVFRKLQMDGFMLGQSEIVRWCKEQGMAIGTARGSVGGSRVAYVTDIIDLNPETWHTVFSRFCNEDRKEIGDIDTDVVEADRPAIFKYITDRFGKDKTARVASFGTMLAKKVIEDVGRHLAKVWGVTHQGTLLNNPWSLQNIAKIKAEYDKDPEETKKKYPELFYYFDGLLGTKISQSIHAAGIVISPITLNDNYGVFDKDGESCLMLDMDNIHDYTGLAKYDFLILTTVQIIRDTCNYIGRSYPKTHEINWADEEVWNSILESPVGIFQFESAFAFDCLKKFRPKSIFDMSIVTACIRPSGSSYRNDLLSRKIHKNPSEIIDNLLKDNLGYLIYQEDTIKFLQQICGLTGSEADNIRRAIGRKQKDRLDAALPSILEGYCEKSPKDRAEAETEAKDFLQIIEDSASYQFGYNHSIAYCLLGYLCAYFRHYYPLEFLTAFLNNASNDDDIANGTAYANKVGIKVTMPKFGISKGDYFYDSQENIIAKGLSSVKYMSNKIAQELYELAKQNKYDSFVELLYDIDRKTSLDVRQLDMLIKLDYFSAFGNQRELLKIAELFYTLFNRGNAKQIHKDKINGSMFEDIIEKYSVGVTKSGGIAKSYTLLDIESILKDIEDRIKSLQVQDLSEKVKIENVTNALGYMGYVTGKEEDRRKLYVLEVYPINRRKDKKQIGYSIITKSIGSGKESRLTVWNKLYDADPIHKGDLILCKSFTKDKGWFTLTSFDKIM